MATGEEPTQANPIVADTAPRLHLVLKRNVADTRIQCRRMVTLLGSRDACKVRLQHQSVAPVHVAIVNDGSRILAVDLITKKGTLLNRLKMEYERLRNGDLLAIPPWEFWVDIEEPTHSDVADTHPFGLDPTSHVIVLEHMSAGRLLHPNRDLCVIGRRHGCDIVLSDSSVSRAARVVAQLLWTPGNL